MFELPAACTLVASRLACLLLLRSWTPGVLWAILWHESGPSGQRQIANAEDALEKSVRECKWVEVSQLPSMESTQTYVFDQSWATRWVWVALFVTEHCDIQMTSLDCCLVIHDLPRARRRLEASLEDAVADKEKAQALVTAERGEVSLTGFILQQ